jgi:thioredoxin-like negative regulator of GroEL
MRPRSLGNLLLPIACLLAAAPAAASQGWLTSLAAARAAAAESRRPILVDLYAEWCGWCKVLDREVFSTPRFTGYAEKFVLLRVDVEDGAEGSRLQERFEAMSLPTTLVVDGDLALVGRVEGFSPLEVFIAKLEAELAQHQELLETYERARAGSDGEALTLLAGDFHRRADGRRAAALYQRLLAVSQPAPAAADWLRYRRADALRLAGELERATAALAEVRAAAAARGDTELGEAADVLRFQLAHEAGACREAIAALEAFLAAHPGSELRSYVRRTLKELQQKPTCT